MGKRVRFKIGDIFCIRLENDLFGFGRILRISKATVFIELAAQKPVAIKTKPVGQFKTMPVLMIWCYDDKLRNGEWEIVDNIPVARDIAMPFFWTQDAGNGKFYLIKGTDDIYGESTGIIIEKEETNNYPPYGIKNTMNIPGYYMGSLLKMNLL